MALDALKLAALEAEQAAYAAEFVGTGYATSKPVPLQLHTDVLIVPSDDPEYKYWKMQILNAVTEICVREIVPTMNNPTAEASKGVNFQYVRDIIRLHRTGNKRHWLFVASTNVKTRRGSMRCTDLHAFAIARDAGDALFLDVICRKPAKHKVGPRVPFGDLLLQKVEAHAAALGKRRVELAALNAWLCDHWYGPRGYLEKDDPCAGGLGERRQLWACGKDPRAMDDDEVRAACVGLGIPLLPPALLLPSACTNCVYYGEPIEALVRQLEVEALYGFRMARCVRDDCPRCCPSTPTKSGAHKAALELTAPREPPPPDRTQERAKIAQQLYEDLLRFGKRGARGATLEERVRQWGCDVGDSGLDVNFLLECYPKSFASYVPKKGKERWVQALPVAPADDPVQSWRVGAAEPGRGGTAEKPAKRRKIR